MLVRTANFGKPHSLESNQGRLENKYRTSLEFKAVYIGKQLSKLPWKHIGQKQV
jgi:hypothetical protein